MRSSIPRMISLFCLAYFIVSSGLIAQPRKGLLTVGASYGLTGKRLETNKDENVDSGNKDELFSAGFTPRVGYFFTRKVAAGLSMKYGRKILNEEERKMRLATFGPWIRYYLNTRKIAPYFEIEGGAGSFREFASSDLSKKSAVYYLSAGGGTEFFVAPNLSFDFGINFKQTFENPEIPVGTQKINFSNLGFHAGICVFTSWKELTSKKPKPRKSWI